MAEMTLDSVRRLRKPIYSIARKWFSEDDGTMLPEILA